MKLLIILVAFALNACSSLMNAEGAAQPVEVVDAKQQIFFTTCSGSVEEWGTCYSKARKSCVNGYEVTQKVENPTGGRREMTFKCN